MNFLAFLVFGVLGAGLIILLFNGGEGIGPFSEEQFAHTLYLGVLGTVLAAGIFASGQRFGDIARQAGIWLALILMLVIGYEYRFELQETATRVTSSLLPGQPVSSTGADGVLSITLNRRGGHFVTSGKLNGATQRFIVDTGASTVVLTERAAVAAGADPQDLSFTIPVMTANGTALAARLTGIDIDIGGIVRSNMTVLVARNIQLNANLLGMNFLDTLSSYEVRRDRMVFYD